MGIKVLQLNVWMGKIEGNLKRFLRDHNFDVICMQEVMYSKDAERHLAKLCFDASQIIEASGMPYHFFSPNWRSLMANGHLEVGNMILSRIPFASEHSEFVHGHYVPDMILANLTNNLNVQIVHLVNGLTVINHHGYWCPNPMGDTGSIASFGRLAGVIKPLADNAPLVLCGDLNLAHAAPAMRALDFLTDLTHEHRVTTTLSGLKFDGEVACDHIMINSKISAKNFAVMPDLVSDHLALTAELEIR